MVSPPPIGLSPNGKAQHFDCCISRSESGQPCLMSLHVPCKHGKCAYPCKRTSQSGKSVAQPTYNRDNGESCSRYRMMMRKGESVVPLTKRTLRFSGTLARKKEIPPNGNVAELVNAPALKSGCQKWLVGSNPTVAAGFLCQRNSFHPIAECC